MELAGGRSANNRPTPSSCRTLEGPANTRLFKNHTYVHPYVSHSFSCVLLGRYTSDLQYFYRFQTPYKTTIRGADERCPQPPLLDSMATIESNIFVKLLASNITWAILGESPDPPHPLLP